MTGSQWREASSGEIGSRLREPDKNCSSLRWEVIKAWITPFHNPQMIKRVSLLFALAVGKDNTQSKKRDYSVEKETKEAIWINSQEQSKLQLLQGNVEANAD